MRPINADALKESLKELEFQCRKMLWSGAGLYVEALRVVQSMIDSTPTIALPPNDPLTMEELREMDDEEGKAVKIEVRPWKPHDLLDDLQSIINEEPDSYLNTKRVTLCMARDYLKEYFVEHSSVPLTLDELREMDGAPVWCVDGEGNQCWCLVNCDDGFPCCYDNETGLWEDCYYGMRGSDKFGLHKFGWLAYRRRPEEGKDET